MTHEVLVNSLVDAAAVLYRGGVKPKDAASAALNQYRNFDGFDRDVLFTEVCRRLGQRGGKKAQTIAKRERAMGSSRLMRQIPFAFPRPKKI